MLPEKIRYTVFDHLSVKTMRYVTAVPTSQASGLTKQVYDMIQEDFFKNGSLTSRSRVPELMAAIWTAGRESMLVEDKVDRTTKDAICAVLSQANDCPYCSDMLVSLVHAGGDHEAAREIYAQDDNRIDDPLLRERLRWVRAIATPGHNAVPPTPFSSEQLPEVLATLMAMSDINRFSHVVMEDSPVKAPFGVEMVKASALQMFGSELQVTRRRALEPGRALGLLPPAVLPAGMNWAKSNPRVADAMARWTATVERETEMAIPLAVKEAVHISLQNWRGEQLPISRAWVNQEIEGLNKYDAAIAKLAIVLAKAPYQVDEHMAEAVLVQCTDEAQFVRILAWASFAGARRFIEYTAERIGFVSEWTEAAA